MSVLHLPTIELKALRVGVCERRLKTTLGALNLAKLSLRGAEHRVHLTTQIALDLGDLRLQRDHHRMRGAVACAEALALGCLETQTASKLLNSGNGLDRGACAGERVTFDRRAQLRHT